jgi:tRNA threonylcarbamoyladenosine biosynthesis protein TsaB
MPEDRFSHVLALDTSVRQASVALVVEGTTYVAAADATVTVAAQLPDLLLTLLDRCHVALEQVDLLAVATGPGGFTGLRVGIATMQGLALALGRCVVGVPTLASLAYASAVSVPAMAGEVRTVVMSGQRGEQFVAQYAWRPTESGDIEAVESVAPFVRTLSAVVDQPTARFVRPSCTVYRSSDEVAAFSDEGGTAVVCDGPLAPAVAHLGRLLASRGGAGLPHALQPLYVRRPDAELSRERDAALAPPASPRL